MTKADQIQARAREWFVRLEDPDTPASTWLEFQSWLEIDPSHRRAYEAIELLWADLDQLPDRRAANDDRPPGNGKHAPGRSRRTPWLYGSIATAAATALAVGVWTSSGVGSTRTFGTGDAPKTVVLSDGSTVYLNRHTDLQVRMVRDRRAVELSNGEAAFDVAHDATRPFVIAAGEHHIRVLGTAFNVMHDGDRFAVSVERGRVAVRPAHASVDLNLVAGQKLEQVGRRRAVLSRTSTDEGSAWRRGVLIYHDAELAEVAADLSRYFNRPVVISDSVHKLRFTGALQVGDETTMLDQLEDFLPIRASRTAADVRLTPREGR